MPTNGIATAADFRQLTRFEWVLPSGRKILMGLPSAKFLLLHLSRFQTLANRLAQFAQADQVPPTEQEATEFESWMDFLLVDVMIEPRVSFAPQDASELQPREIPALDRLTIFRVAVGEIAPGGADLAEFRKDATGPGTASGASGGDLPRSPEPIAQPDGNDGIPT